MNDGLEQLIKGREFNYSKKRRPGLMEFWNVPFIIAYQTSILYLCHIHPYLKDFLQNFRNDQMTNDRHEERSDYVRWNPLSMRSRGTRFHDTFFYF